MWRQWSNDEWPLAGKGQWLYMYSLNYLLPSYNTIIIMSVYSNVAGLLDILLLLISEMQQRNCYFFY